MPYRTVYAIHVPTLPGRKTAHLQYLGLTRHCGGVFYYAGFGFHNNIHVVDFMGVKRFSVCIINLGCPYVLDKLFKLFCIELI